MKPGGLDMFQMGAVLDRSEDRLIVAPAGSGKTATLVAAVVRDIEDGASASGVLVVTFTNRAALELRLRLHGALEASSVCAEIGSAGSLLDDMEVGTFHAWCLKLIRSHPRPCGRCEGVSVYDDEDRAGLLRRIALDLGVKVGNRKTPDGILAKIAADSERRLAHRAVGEGGPPPLIDTAKAAYENALLRHNAIDFESMIRLAGQLVRASLGLSFRLSGPTPASPFIRLPCRVYVDEYQDTATDQHELMELLRVEAGAKMFRVGDLAQCIYSWRAARPELFEGLRAEVNTPGKPGRSVHTLRVNYRSLTSIVDVGSHIADRVGGVGDVATFRCWSRDRGTEFYTVSTGSVALHVHASDVNMSTGIAASISRASPLGEGAGSTFVIGRTWADLVEIESCLRERGIPHTMIRRCADVWSSRLCRGLIAAMRLSVNEFDARSARTVATWPIALTNDRWLDDLEAEGRLNADSVMTGGFTPMAHNVFKAAVDSMASQDVPDPPPGATLSGQVSALRFAEAYFCAIQNAAPDTDTPDGWRDRCEELMEFIRAWAQAAVSGRGVWRRSSTISDFVSWWTFRRIQDADQSVGGGVKLGTVHAFKGAEADVVHVVGLEEGNWPRADKDGEELEEERRLVYVAATRARDELHLHTCGLRPKTWGKGKRTATPSRLLSLFPIGGEDRSAFLSGVDPVGQFKILPGER